MHDPMRQPSTSGPAGLIVIESSGEASDTAQGGAGDDATLAQVIRRLALGADVVPQASRADVASWRLGVSRFSRPAGDVVHGSIVAADCGRLAVQLEAAARQLRRTIAVAARIAR
jgi:hypothetical protein